MYRTMRFKSFLFGTTGALVVVGAMATIGCGDIDGGAQANEGQGSASDTVTVTTMVEDANGNWTSTSRSIPKPPPNAAVDGIETREGALTRSPCAHGSKVVLYSDFDFTGNILCLQPTGTRDKLTFFDFPGRSGYTVMPIYLYNAVGGLVFFSCNNTLKSSSRFSAVVFQAQEVIRSGICHF